MEEDEYILYMGEMLFLVLLIFLDLWKCHITSSP